MTSEPTVDLAALRDRFAEIPITESLRMTLGAVSPGKAVMNLPYDRRFDGVFQSLHGGIMMTLADTVACAAIMTLAGVSAAMTTTDMDIRFLAACRTNCQAEATVIKFGRTLVPVQVNLRDQEGTLVAIARVTYMRLNR